MYAFWKKYFTKRLYSYWMVKDASDFIGIEMFTLLHDSEYSFHLELENESGENKKNTLKTLSGQQVCMKFLIESIPKLDTSSPDSKRLRSRSSKTQLQIETHFAQKAEPEIPDMARMSADSIFGGSLENDAKIFDMPMNDELYKAKYKAIIVNSDEDFLDREDLFSFFRYYTISDKERIQLWRTRIGNTLGITRSLFENLIIRLEIEGISKKECKLINDDLVRTLPNYGITKVGDTMYKRLHQLLSLFQLYRPDVGYVQGMSFLIVMLYYYYDEFDTFTLFCNLIITKPLVWICYDFDIPQVTSLQTARSLQSHLHLEAGEKDPQSHGSAQAAKGVNGCVSHRLALHYF